MRAFALLFFLAASLAHGQTALNSTQTEARDLIEAAVPFAEQMLVKHGAFFPYGKAIDSAGKIVSLAVSDGREQPPASDLIRLLKEVFKTRAKSGQYKATALIYEVRVTLPKRGVKSDAIAVSLNHERDLAVLMFFPYKLEGGKVVIGEIMVQREENYVFGSK